MNTTCQEVKGKDRNVAKMEVQSLTRYFRCERSSTEDWQLVL